MYPEPEARAAIGLLMYCNGTCAGYKPLSTIAEGESGTRAYCESLICGLSCVVGRHARKYWWRLLLYRPSQYELGIQKQARAFAHCITEKVVWEVVFRCCGERRKWFEAIEMGNDTLFKFKCYK